MLYLKVEITQRLFISSRFDITNFISTVPGAAGASRAFTCGAAAGVAVALGREAEVRAARLVQGTRVAGGDGARRAVDRLQVADVRVIPQQVAAVFTWETNI